MKIFDLPKPTEFGRVVPKNAFDNYINTKQKKEFTDFIQRITWTHKLSTETTNLKALDIKEIQVFRVELKLKMKIDKVLEIIDKAIPYHILFVVEFNQEAYVSTASKHPHIVKLNTSVIDWVFTSDWHSFNEINFQLNLANSLDEVFKDICVQIADRPSLSEKSMKEVVEIQQDTRRLVNEITKIRSTISKSKQFNKKVALNLELKKKEEELRRILEK